MHILTAVQGIYIKEEHDSPQQKHNANVVVDNFINIKFCIQVRPKFPLPSANNKADIYFVGGKGNAGNVGNVEDGEFSVEVLYIECFWTASIKASLLRSCHFCIIYTRYSSHIRFSRFQQCAGRSLALCLVGVRVNVC